MQKVKEMVRVFPVRPSPSYMHLAKAFSLQNIPFKLVAEFANKKLARTEVWQQCIVILSHIRLFTTENQEGYYQNRRKYSLKRVNYALQLCSGVVWLYIGVVELACNDV